MAGIRFSTDPIWGLNGEGQLPIASICSVLVLFVTGEPCGSCPGSGRGGHNRFSLHFRGGGILSILLNLTHFFLFPPSFRFILKWKVNGFQPCVGVCVLFVIFLRFLILPKFVGFWIFFGFFFEFCWE